MRESYQQRMLESKSKVIICDWDRGKREIIFNSRFY